MYAIDRWIHALEESGASLERRWQTWFGHILQGAWNDIKSNLAMHLNGWQNTARHSSNKTNVRRHPGARLEHSHTTKKHTFQLRFGNGVCTRRKHANHWHRHTRTQAYTFYVNEVFHLAGAHIRFPTRHSHNMYTMCNIYNTVHVCVCGKRRCCVWCQRVNFRFFVRQICRKTCFWYSIALVRTVFDTLKLMVAMEATR